MLLVSQFFLSRAEFKCVSEHYWKTKKEKPIIVFGYKPIKLNSGMFKMDILLWPFDFYYKSNFSIEHQGVFAFILNIALSFTLRTGTWHSHLYTTSISRTLLIMWLSILLTTLLVIKQKDKIQLNRKENAWIGSLMWNTVLLVKCNILTI